jgi:iron complex transport system substrate-binding protein
MYKPLRFVAALSLSALTFPLLTSAVSSASTPSGCIVSLSPSASATLYAIGAGSQVGAVDENSTYPAAAAALAAKNKIDALSPSAEAIAGICPSSFGSPKPRAVIISYDANGLSAKLSALGIKVITQDAPTTLAGALSQITSLGVLTGDTAGAKKVVTSINNTISKDVASVSAHPGKVVKVYYEIGTNPYYSLTSSTFVGSLMAKLGVTNIADADATSADAGYPSLSAEYILKANPNLVFTADGSSASSVAKRTGFANVAAVKAGEVYALNDNEASEWGPQLGDLMNQITAAVKSTLANTTLWK